MVTFSQLVNFIAEKEGPDVPGSELHQIFKEDLRKELLARANRLPEYSGSIFVNLEVLDDIGGRNEDLEGI